MISKKYYLGLDIGTDSIGYAATDEKYNLLKFNGDYVWGVHIFDEASLNTDRRSYRSARRRLDRRQQRVKFIQELFYPEIKKVDSDFFKRICESFLFREDVDDDFTLFNDENFTDKDYYKKYPTIHHLIVDLMHCDNPRDIRLVYLACVWLVAHRGHFLNNINKDNLSEIKMFDSVYKRFTDYFIDNGLDLPWTVDNPSAIGDILKQKTGVTNKQKMLKELLFNGKKAPKEPRESFPYNTELIIKLLSGGTCKLKDLFCNDEYADAGSASLKLDDDRYAEIIAAIGDDYELIDVMRGIMDWSVLVETLGDFSTISEAKVNIFEQHKKDLKSLKYIIKKYKKEKYNEVFRDERQDNYVAYSGKGKTKAKKDAFSKYISGIIKTIVPDDDDKILLSDMQERLSQLSFLPKQKETDNRVIPHQLYWYELKTILENAEKWLTFLCEKDEDGISISEKILSVFLFRIPYFVGPLNKNSAYSWLERKAGKIYPWNFEEMVDLDKSEQNFIEKMTNFCTYLPGEPVIPKNSIIYQKFSVLNEINNLKINGEKISVELKQKIYNDLFLSVKKVTKKKLTDYLICSGAIEKGQEDFITGIDKDIKSSLSSYIAFKKLISEGVITINEAEKIIERAAYAEDKTRLGKWIIKNYPHISDEDRKYICSLKIKDFGRLSRKFLTGIEGVNRSTGEINTVIDAMWNTNNNLMELLSKEYTFTDVIETFSKEYYSENPLSLNERMDQMYLSNSVKRSVFRTLDVVNDIKKAFGPPEKIFVETTRSKDNDLKGKRTKTRKQQILDLYAQCQSEDIPELTKQLEAMGENADSRLRSDKLFLYYMQLGKCVYSGKTIDLIHLATKDYDIDHIYPQAYIKDDSIINNKVLVLSEENGKKSDNFPVSAEIQKKMQPFWHYLYNAGLMSQEKYKRLTRVKPFSADEKTGFIARQLTETSQATKAVASILKDIFPEAEIVYSKAGIVSEFRQEFDCIKSRTFNDLHHASDAYLNIVTGNVYNMRFTKKWFSVDSKYSIKTKTIFTHPLICDGITVWDPDKMLELVKKTANKNTAHFTKYSYFKKGGFFDQMPVSAAKDLTPLKKNLPTEKYGGYNRPGVMFFIPVKYKSGKKSEIIIMSVELLHGKEFLEDADFAKEYTFKRLNKILGKPVDCVDFPLGMRPWKVNTVLSLDGFKICIAGSAGGGKCLIAQPIMQFSESNYWRRYIKRLEKLDERLKSHPDFEPDPVFDKITAEDNIKLYDIYLNKLENTIYSKRVNAPATTLKDGRNKFLTLSVKEQGIALLNIHSVFGRTSRGCNLKAVGGSEHSAATVNFSASISNWKKNYKDVRIIDVSPSGLWEKKSENILELL